MTTVGLPGSVTAVEPVPFLDLLAENAAFREELDLAWQTVRNHGLFVGGPEVARFEVAFAAYCQSAQAVGVANGTDALELILAGLGIGRGDEVIVPANTFIATAEAVCAVGARPRFVDVLPETLLIDADAVAAAVRPSTVAVIAVHLFGQMVDIDRLLPVAGRHGLAVIEDAAQAHGATFADRRAGSVGTAAAFSFYPSKNLGALGDGGAVVSDDIELIDRIRRLSNHGRAAEDRYRHDTRGRNSRMDSIQAAVLAAKLLVLDEANVRRAAAMARYRERLPADCVPLEVHPLANPVYHLAIVRVPDRARITAQLTATGIGWGVHYPIPCHRQPGYAEFADRLPVAEHAADEILSLPMHPTLTDAQVERVCEVLGGICP